MTRTLRQVAIVTPIFDDWECLSVLAKALHEHLAPHGWSPIIVAVDDGSHPTEAAHSACGASIVIRLARNVGHQRAIAVGLDYVVQELGVETIVVMDSDGEDRPEAVIPLLRALDGANARIVVASRLRRSESWRFRIFYHAYKCLFWALTGESIDFGNFSAMSRSAARRLTAMHELWLNVPGTMVRSRLELARLPIDRGRRYAGQSRMNFVALVVHGMSAIGVFVERAFTRALLSVGVLAGAMLGGFLLALVLKWFGLATPGWVTTIAATLVVVLVQTAMIALAGLLMIFGSAANVTAAPAATARTLIDRVDRPVMRDTAAEPRGL